MNRDIIDILLKEYTLIATSEDPQVIPDEKICRFCRKQEPEVSFKKIAHVVSELLGINNTQSYSECDSCNSHFAGYESHLAILFRPYLTMIGIKGKKGVPVFQSRSIDGDENTRAQVKFETETKRRFEISHADDCKIDWVSGKISMIFRLPPYRPMYVYKALLKIGLSLLPEKKIEDYKTAFDWIYDKDEVSVPHFPVAFISILPRKKFATPSASLCEAKKVYTEENFLPNLTLIVSFANIIVQIFLPLPDSFDYTKSKNLSPALNILPASLLSHDSKMFRDKKPTDKVTLKYRFDSIDLSKAETVSHDEKIDFVFDINNSQAHSDIE